MKLVAQAGVFASALSLAAAAARKKGVVRLVTEDGAVSLSCSDNTVAIIATVAATASEPGEIAVSIDQLAALVAGFWADATVTVTASETAATIVCGNSRSRLPLIPDMPAALAIADEIANVEIAGSGCLHLLEPLAAAASEQTQFYLTGVFWHTVGKKLTAIVTDGVRLIKTSIPSAEFSTDRHCILPAGAVAVLRRLVTRTKPDKVTLRRSRTLLAVAGPGFEFTSRLIDAKYPVYEAVVPVASPNAVTVDRSELLAALSRLAAVATADPPLLALSWTNAGPLKLFLARQPDDGADAIAAQAHGAAKVAVPLQQLAAMIEEFSGERVQLEAAGPLVIRGEGEKFALLMPSAWNFGC